MSDRGRLHRLVQQLPETELLVALRFLEFLCFRTDPLLGHLDHLVDGEAPLPAPGPVPAQVLEVAQDPQADPHVLASLAQSQDKTVREAVAYNPQTPREVLERLAMDHAVEVRLGAARSQHSAAAYRQVLESSPGELQEASFALAKTLEMAGKLEEAVEEYKRFLERKPLEVEARYRLAEIYLQLNNEKEAEKIYRNIARINPNDTRPYLLLGDRYMAREQWADAIKAYEEAARIMPNSLDISKNIFKAKNRLRRTQGG